MLGSLHRAVGLVDPDASQEDCLLSVGSDQGQGCACPVLPKKTPVSGAETEPALGPGCPPEPHTVLMTQSWSGPQAPAWRV